MIYIIAKAGALGVIFIVQNKLTSGSAQTTKRVVVFVLYVICVCCSLQVLKD